MPIARPPEVDSLGVINLIGSNLIDKYSPRSILKELLQNADDAGAGKVVVGWTPGLGGNAVHQLLHGPALFVVNDGKFTANDAQAICRFGQNYKFGERAVIGKFGLGLKSVFHLCEAFFYLSSVPPDGSKDDGLFNNLASPWVRTEYHRDWNNVTTEDLQLLRDFLLPICSPLGDDWFALWLPLRQRAYCQTVRFSSRYDGELSACPLEILEGITEGAIARSLPLLHSVKGIRFWQCWKPGAADDPSPSAELKLLPDAGRSVFRDYLRYVEESERLGSKPECFDTRYQNNGRFAIGCFQADGTGCVAKVGYALVQSWSPDLLVLTEEGDWPKSFVLAGGQQPDKAQPHTAVLLGRRQQKSGGELDVVVAVFLPLDAEEPEFPKRDQSECEFILTLHGCFFVDSGRNAPYVGPGVRGDWNRRLMSEGVLSSMISAVESLAATNGCNSEIVYRLTKAIDAWLTDPKPNSVKKLADGSTRECACRKDSWVFRWHSDGARWERVERKVTALEIPNFGSDEQLPGHSMPGLCDLATEIALVPTGVPRLMAVEPEPWGDNLLAQVLDVAAPESWFPGGGAGLGYFHDFVSSQRNLGSSATAGLLGTLRRVFSRIGSGALRGPENSFRDKIKSMVELLPPNRRLGLPLGGNWPDDARRKICGADIGALIVPDEFEPPEPGVAQLTAIEAVRVLELLAPFTTVDRRGNPALVVLTKTSDSESVTRSTTNLALWRADRLTSTGIEPGIVSQAQMLDGRLTLAGEVSEAVKALVEVLAKSEVWVISGDVARIVTPTLPSTDVSGVVSVLGAFPRLAESGLAFLPLLKSLRFAEQTQSWKIAVRYLIHRSPTLPPDVEVLIGDRQQGVWGKLAAAALAISGHPERVVPASDLTRSLDPVADSLGFAQLDANSVAALVREAGVERIEISFTPEERMAVLRGWQDHADLIRGLPLHDAADGSGMKRINQKSYWAEAGEIGTLSGTVTLLQLCQDERLAAIQRNVHQQILKPIEVVRLALQYGPANHCQTLLTAIQSTGTVPRELRDALVQQAWLPLRAGGRIAPANVLHDEKLSDVVIDLLRLISRAPGDPVSSDDLSPMVRDHSGFRELGRQFFPEREQLVGRLAQVLKRDDRFQIGDVDLWNQDKCDEWLDAFRDARNDVMAARNLIARVDAVDHKLCAGRLLPPLRDGNIPIVRLERILVFLRDRHDKGLGVRPATLRIHNDYLRKAAVNCVAFKSMLPRLKLLSEAGSWVDPASLCVATGLDPAKTLDFEQQELLKECVPAQPVLNDLQLERPDDPTSEFRVADHHFAESVQRLRQYFDDWTDSEEVAGWAGAFLALLGDYEPLQALANEFLGISSPGRTVWYVRSKAGMHDARRLTIGATKPETPSEMMGRQRLLVRLTDPSHAVEVTNLLGNRIAVNARTEFDTLLLGFGMDRIDCPYLKGSVVRCLHLRKVKPSSIHRKTLRELVARTGELVLRVFFGQEESRIEFASVLEEFSGDDEFGVRVAQEAFLDGAQYYLPLLGLNGSLNPHLRDLFRLADSITNRRSEESAIEAAGATRSLSGRNALSMEKEFRERLRTLIIDERDVRQELVAAVQRKVRQFQYGPRSVLFELFQNADDAYGQRGSTPDESPVFIVRQTAKNLTVFHNGRPINRSTGGDREAVGNHHDLRMMLSFGHSNKQLGPSVGNVTGKFGLGFKSVFLITDHPQVTSGRLAFEVFGGVYPKPISDGRATALRTQAETVGLPREATVFDLPVGDGTILEEAVAPFHQLAHFLVVFSHCTRAIRFNGNSTSWEDHGVLKKDQIQIARGTLRPLSNAEGSLRQALVIRCGSTNGDVLFGIDDSGFVPISSAVPSIWVTTPTTDYHDVGYLVNAPLEPDPGRSLVNLNTADNIERLRCLSVAVGDALIALFDTGTSVLSASANPDDVWRSFWAVLSKARERHDLHDRFIWGEFGAATRFYAERAALPTGLDALDYRNLTSLGISDAALHGILDRHPAVFALVAKWDAFHRQHRAGSVVSYKRVGKHLPKQLARIDLAALLAAELQDSFVNPELAGQLGQVLTRDRLIQWKETGEGEEVLLIRKALETARFQNSAGKWVAPALLVTNVAEGDEAMRAAFAPDNRLLFETYCGNAAQFFLTCRGPMQADADLLAEWVCGAGENKKRRKAALQYLGRGELGSQVKRRLYDERLIEGTWLGDLTKEEMEEAGLSEYEQGVLSAGLGQPVGAPAPPPPPLPAPDIFKRIAEWWRVHATKKTRQYNHWIYSDGRPPGLTPAGPGQETASRVEWLKLFVTGIVQTIGRVTPEQNRAFIQLCESERWLLTLADHVNGPREWLSSVESYIDRHHGDSIRYFYWLRHFVSVATVSRHLDAYAQSFLAIDRFDGRFAPRDLLSIRTSRQFQFGGPDAPTLVPILGIGASFVLRELVRMGLVTRDDVHPYCFSPVRRLRQFLERLGWTDDENGSVHERSRSIYNFIDERYPDNPTFDGAFDIPLLMYAEEHPEILDIRESQDSGEWITLADGRRVPLG